MSDDGERGRAYTEEFESSNHDSKSKPGAKPRASRAGTRSVTTLNAEQLARKRANDREAQRAIRQRTREHIERLENRIKELSENNPESDAAFEAVQRRNAELEDELGQLRKALYGMGDASNSSAISQQPHSGYVPQTRVKMEPVAYPPHPPPTWGGQQQVNLGHLGYAPTSNPVLEPGRSWQPNNIPTHPLPGQRELHHHQHPGIIQTTSWSRNDSDSDYDSSYGHDQEPAGMRHPVSAHPDMHNLYNPHQAHYQGRPDVMWQHPNGPTSNGSYEGPHVGSRDDANLYGVNSYVSQPSTPGWSPQIQNPNRDAYF